LPSLLAACLAGLLVFNYPQSALFVLFLFFALLGPVGWLLRAALALTGRRPAQPPEPGHPS
jgi:hypothetical protein